MSLNLSEGYRNRIQELAGLLSEADAATVLKQVQPLLVANGLKSFNAVNFKDATKGGNQMLALETSPQQKIAVTFFANNTLFIYVNVKNKALLSALVNQTDPKKTIGGAKAGKIADVKIPYVHLDQQNKPINRTGTFTQLSFVPTVANPNAAPNANQPAVKQALATFKESES